MLQRITNKFKPFQKGDKVWLESKNLKLWYESQKLAPKQEGLFKIQEVLGPLTYQLELSKQWKIHPVFHATLLSPYKENDTYGNNFTHPPPDLIDGQEEYCYDFHQLSGSFSIPHVLLTFFIVSCWSFHVDRCCALMAALINL